MSFNGEFLLEINTSATAATVQTFRIKQDAQGNFAGFERDAAGNLVIAPQTLSVVGGFRLMMAGKLVVLDTLEISGRVDFSVQLAGATPSVELIVNGKLSLEPIGGITLTDSGFRISGEGLVARIQVDLGADFGSKIGLKFSVSALLAINTTSRTQTLGTSTVERGLTIRIDGSVEFLGFASASGFVEIKLGPAGFELTFAVGFYLGGLSFRADGGAVVRGGSDPGFALLLNIHATADATVFSIDARGTLQLNTMNHSELGVIGEDVPARSPGPRRDPQGRSASTRACAWRSRNGGWSFLATASMDFFGIATLSGSLYLDSRGNFDFQLKGEIVLGTRSFGIVGEFSIRFRNQVTLINGNPYYVVEISGSARVSARLFGISFGGLGVSFSAKVEGFGGRAKITLSVTVEIDLLLVTVSKTASFTIGYIELGPPPVYLGGQQADGHVWTDAGGVLYLNAGDRTPFRDFAEDEANEEFLIEQIDGDATKGTIKVVAFGRTNIYSNVTEIVGELRRRQRHRQDRRLGQAARRHRRRRRRRRHHLRRRQERVDPQGRLRLGLPRDQRRRRRDDGGRRRRRRAVPHRHRQGRHQGRRRRRHADRQHEGRRAVRRRRRRRPRRPGRQGHGRARATTSSGSSSPPPTGSSSTAAPRPTTCASRSATPTTRSTCRSSAARRCGSCSTAATRDLTSIEKLSIDGRAGADTFLVRDLQDSGLTDLTLDLGKRVVVNGTRSETVTFDGKTFTREVPNEITSPDVRRRLGDDPRRRLAWPTGSR